MLPEFTREELAAELDHVVEEVLDESGVWRPPIDAVEVARRLGIELAWDDRQSGRARYVRLGERFSGCSRATILLRPDPRPERRQWAVAHEIGEHVAYRVFDRLGVDPRETVPGARENVANSLAGRLLLPSRWFDDDGVACGWDLLSLKSRYSTASHELIARRMLECRPPVVISIFDNGRVTFRRGNCPGRAPPPLKIELECRRRVHQCGRPMLRRAGPCSIQCWPIHEEGWKREIIRLEVDEYYFA